jgi:hypothetical protein
MRYIDQHTGARGMWLRAANTGGGRYLLMRRPPRGPDPELYRAARWLVDQGYARWLDWSSNFAPGIELTGKPWRT